MNITRFPEMVISFVIISFYLTAHLSAQNSPQIRGLGETWAATDALGRSLPTYHEVGSPRNNKYVGIFYFLWHDTPNHGGGTEIYDITKFLNKNHDDPAYGPRLKFHWWGEPEAGYYRAKDPWVIRRNLQMLSDAGVDFLYLDATNAITYLDVVEKLCYVSVKMRKEGISTPYICFLTHTKSAEIINQLYLQFYSKNKYSDLWFLWDGKPLIFGDYWDTTISEAAKNFFTFRYSWAWTDTETNPDHWQWLDSYPQDYGWTKNLQTPEQIPVSVASHPTLNIGGSYHNGSQPPTNQFKLTEFTGQGLFFEEQWKRAHEVDPEVVMITGWNEWTAFRFIAPGDGNSDFLGKPATEAPSSSFFVDVYNQEYNRDIEPMKGGHTDNRYYQMINNIRRFKGMPEVQIANSSYRIEIDANFSDWDNVQPVFVDPKGDTEHRNWGRYDGKKKYINTTGRNDIIKSCATYNNNNIYFYVETDSSLTPHTGKNWMLLFIDSDTDKSTGWEGYEYIVNLKVKSDSLTTLSVWQDSSWNEVDDLKYGYEGNKIEIQVPNNLIAQTGENILFYFHWVDNIQKLDDITEFFISGDSAPNRRFNYYFTTNAKPTSMGAINDELDCKQNKVE